MRWGVEHLPHNIQKKGLGPENQAHGRASSNQPQWALCLTLTKRHPSEDPGHVSVIKSCLIVQSGEGGDPNLQAEQAIMTRNYGHTFLPLEWPHTGPRNSGKASNTQTCSTK